MVNVARYPIEYTRDTDLLQQPFLAKIVACSNLPLRRHSSMVVYAGPCPFAFEVAAKLNILYAFAPGLGLNGSEWNIVERNSFYSLLTGEIGHSGNRKSSHKPLEAKTFLLRLAILAKVTPFREATQGGHVTASRPSLRVGHGLDETTCPLTCSHEFIPPVR